MALYREASKIIRAVLEKKGSTRSLVFSSSIENKKALFALVCESLKYSDFLKTVVSDIKLLSLEKNLRHDEYLAVVLLYDHLLGRGVTGKYRSCIQKYKSAIHSRCELLKVRAGVADIKQFSNQKSAGALLPRYVRVNSLKTTLTSVVTHLKKQGWKQAMCDVKSMLSANSVFTVDPDVPGLLVFPPNTDFHDNPLYKSGEIILQDKASCFPAFLLAPPPGSHVIDCCAAPGNKTTHLASIIRNTGKVFAFDKDAGRLSTLTKMTSRAGASCVTAQCQDFLTVKPDDQQYRNVQYILVDPSCSGTGIVNRVGGEGEAVSEKRLKQLANFQVSILKHALSFPHVHRVIYSTCSIHEEENERVVEEVYEQVKKNFIVQRLMPDWPERGVQSYSHGQCCLRLSPQQSLTNGFFVSCFERQSKNIGVSHYSDCGTGMKVTVESLDSGISSVPLKTAVESESTDSLTTSISLSNASEDGVTAKKRKKRKRKRKHNNLETLPENRSTVSTGDSLSSKMSDRETSNEEVTSVVPQKLCKTDKNMDRLSEKRTKPEKKRLKKRKKKIKSASV